MKSAYRLAAVAALPVLLSSCSGMYSTSIVYAPTPAAPSPGGTAISLTVVDQRPPDEGGTDPRHVGKIRALAGNAARMSEASADSVRRLVESATSDGLAAAGLNVSPGRPEALEVVLTKFWMDGYASYTARIEATFTLRRDGTQVLSQVVSTSATGEQTGSPSEMFSRVWGSALAKWRDEVSRAAASPSFTAAAGGRTPPSAAPASPAATPKPIRVSAVRLIVGSEFGIDDSEKLTFQIRARDALKKVGLIEKRDAPEAVAVRYVVNRHKDRKTGKVDRATISTRLSLLGPSDLILAETSFTVEGDMGGVAESDKSLLSANLGLVVDFKWVPQVVKRLQSPEFAKALGR